MEKEPTIAISPVSNRYLTKGKKYPITFIKKSDSTNFGYYFHVLDDVGDVVISHEHGSLHTDGKSWILK